MLFLVDIKGFGESSSQQNCNSMYWHIITKYLSFLGAFSKAFGNIWIQTFESKAQAKRQSIPQPHWVLYLGSILITFIYLKNIFLHPLHRVRETYLRSKIKCSKRKGIKIYSEQTDYLSRDCLWWAQMLYFSNNTVQTNLFFSGLFSLPPLIWFLGPSLSFHSWDKLWYFFLVV